MRSCPLRTVKRPHSRIYHPMTYLRLLPQFSSTSLKFHPIRLQIRRRRCRYLIRLCWVLRPSFTFTAKANPTQNNNSPDLRPQRAPRHSSSPCHAFLASFPPQPSSDSRTRRVSLPRVLSLVYSLHVYCSRHCVQAQLRRLFLRVSALPSTKAAVRRVHLKSVRWT